MNTPKTIYLQCRAPDGMLLDLVHDDVTWCVDQINENDAVYTLARAQHESRVRGECLEIAINTLRWYANDVLVGRRASEALAQIEQRLAQPEPEEEETG